MNIYDYKVVIGQTVEQLNKKVGLMMDDEWKPLGPAAYCPSDSQSHTPEAFFQTMVKYDD